MHFRRRQRRRYRTRAQPQSKSAFFASARIAFSFCRAGIGDRDREGQPPRRSLTYQRSELSRTRSGYGFDAAARPSRNFSDLSILSLDIGRCRRVAVNSEQLRVGHLAVRDAGSVLIKDVKQDEFANMVLFTAAVKWTHRRQIVHNRAKPGVGFRLQAAVPGRGNNVVHVGIANSPQRPHEGLRLV